MIYTGYWNSIATPITTGGYGWKTANEFRLDVNHSSSQYVGSFVRSTIPNGKLIHRADLIKQLLASNENSIVLIITNDQMSGFNEYLENHQLEEYVAKRVDTLVNENYPGTTPRLNIIVLAGKEHLIRK